MSTITVPDVVRYYELMLLQRGEAKRQQVLAVVDAAVAASNAYEETLISVVSSEFRDSIMLMPTSLHNLTLEVGELYVSFDTVKCSVEVWSGDECKGSFVVTAYKLSEAELAEYLRLSEEIAAARSLMMSFDRTSSSDVKQALNQIEHAVLELTKEVGDLTQLIGHQQLVDLTNEFFN